MLIADDAHPQKRTIVYSKTVVYVMVCELYLKKTSIRTIDYNYNIDEHSISITVE